jgi:hypothetical protein
MICQQMWNIQIHKVCHLYFSRNTIEIIQNMIKLSIKKEVTYDNIILLMTFN